jgi:uncharacterized protein YuzE
VSASVSVSLALTASILAVLTAKAGQRIIVKIRQKGRILAIRIFKTQKILK